LFIRIYDTTGQHRVVAEEEFDATFLDGDVYVLRRLGDIGI
jgi:hypothetical protein